MLIDSFNASWNLQMKFSLEGISVQFYLESMSSMPAISKIQKVIHKTSWNNIFPPLTKGSERKDGKEY